MQVLRAVPVDMQVLEVALADIAEDLALAGIAEDLAGRTLAREPAVGHNPEVDPVGMEREAVVEEEAVDTPEEAGSRAAASAEDAPLEAVEHILGRIAGVVVEIGRAHV